MQSVRTGGRRRLWIASIVIVVTAILRKVRSASALRKRSRLLAARAAPINSAPGPPAWSEPSHARCRSEEHTSELQSRLHLVCRLLLEKKKQIARQPFRAHV